jgi:hypothetical protein
MKKRCAVLAAFYVAFAVGGAAEAQWTKVYEQDFSSDPGWTTNDPGNLDWDQGSGTYHTVLTNQVPGQYAYVEVPWDGKGFKLEFDFRIDSCDWSAGLSVGLFDPALHFGKKSVAIDASIGDCGHALNLTADSDGTGSIPADVDCPGGWESGVWYATSIEYDRDTLKVSAVVTERDTGQVKHALTALLIEPLPDTMTRVGVSRVHMEGMPNGATVDASIDNVVLSIKQEECRADYNHDGALDIFDFLAFFNDFAKGCQ